MRFVISTEKRDNSAYHGLLEAVEEWDVFVWELRRKDESAVCASARDFNDETAARSDIASAKVAMKAAKFAKVEVE